MAWLIEHWFAAALFAAYTALLVLHARAGLRAGASADGYFVAGRRLGGVVVGISFYATFASTNSYIGHAGKSYEYGVAWLTMAVLLVVFAWLSWRLVAPRMRRFTAAWGSLTVPDFLAVRFASERVRLAAGVVVAFSSLLYLVAVFKGAGHLLQIFLGIPYEVAVGATLAMIVGYTSVGGFLSVVRTDVVQGVLMAIGSVLIFYFVTTAAGGVGVVVELPSQPGAGHLFELDAALPFVVLLGIAFAGSLKLLVDPRQLTRFYGLRDERSIRVGIWVAAAGILVIQFCLFPVGLYARFLLDGVTDTDLIVPTLVRDGAVFPPLARDFLVVAILAAAMSSLDSVLLVAASVTTRDIAGRWLQSPSSPGVDSAENARIVVWTRICVVAFAVVAAVVALRPPGGIVELTIFSGSLFAVCFVPTILLGLHWRRGDEAAALAAFGIGIGVLLVWIAAGLDATVHEVFPALACSTTAYVFLAWRRPAVATPQVSRLFAAPASRSTDGLRPQPHSDESRC